MGVVLVFAFDKDKKANPGIHLKGYFDGNKFIAKPGCWNSLEELYNYDYVQLFGRTGMVRHIPKKYQKNLLEEMKCVHANEFGTDEQLSFLN